VPETTCGTSTTSSRDSPRAAEALVERLLTATERLAAFPESGRIVPEFPALGYREIIVSSYRVLYRLADNTV
jgi:toxin ParE1/3/4